MNLDDNRKCAGCGRKSKDWVRIQVARASEWRTVKTCEAVTVCFDCTDKLISLIDVPAGREDPLE